MARLALLLALATPLCILFVDQPVAHWVAAHDTIPGGWSGVLHVLEYAIGIEPWRWIGVCVLVAGALATQLVWRRQRTAWTLVALTHLLATNVMWWSKLAFGRLRPLDWHGGATFFEGGGSFPSGHVMLFASVVLPIVTLYPRAWPLLAVPIYAAIARVMVNAHFVSDVVGGFAATAAITALCAAAVRRSAVASSPLVSTSPKPTDPEANPQYRK